MKRIVFLLFSVFCACALSAQSLNTLTPKEEKQGWVLLFSGTNLDGWTSVGKNVPPTNGWTVEDGT